MPTDLDPRPLVYRLLIFLLGAFGSYLLLVAGLSLPYVIALYAFLAFVLLLYGISLSGSGGKAEREQYSLTSRRWVTIVVGALGYGVGVGVFLERLGLRDLGARLAGRLDTFNGAFLAGLMCFGFIMGFYVVRNWLKDDEEFVKSLTAVAGVAFLSSILGIAQGQNQPNQSGQQLGVNMMSAFANYLLGFTLSAVVNLAIYAFLTASYSATKSSGSRAIIFFLYGTDKAKHLDDYFLRNFEADKNYAKMHLVHALREFRKRVLRVYAEKIEEKRQSLAMPTQSPPREPLTFYRLVSIEGKEPSPLGVLAASPPAEEDNIYKVKLEEFTDQSRVTGDMFRMGITIMLPDNLEYIIAPGEYKQPFPLRRSVAGLALAARQTIIMSRDRSRIFRDENEVSITPGDREAPRGFEEVNYLSYISIPVVSRLGDREEQPLGIINVDTLLFAAPAEKIIGERVSEGGKFTVETAMSPKALRGYAVRLYDEDDPAVKYLEDMRAVAVPLLELYLKCRQGAT
ncbi:MAG TPA: hypothetical protein VK422_03090 [Pyrinomonadaceae bacterium]|nr:hypothetical protein [Pyrinomonadaceae bacterium]